MEAAGTGVAIDDFEVIEPVQTGSYFNLMHVKSKADGQDFYLKEYFWNISPQKVIHEFEMLQTCKATGTIRPITLVRNTKDGDLKLAAIFEYRPFQHFRGLIEKITGSHIVSYMRSLINCVASVHKHNIICRDVKPSVFLYDINSETGVISELWFSHLEGEATTDGKSRRGGTRGFRAPEVLIGVNDQTKAIDMWSVGVIFLSLVTQRYPFFCGKTDGDNLCQIAAIVGARRLREAAAELGVTIQFPVWVSEDGVPLQDLTLGLNPTHRDKCVDANAYDLLDRLLDPSPARRITADEALAHPFLRMPEQ